MLWLASVFTGFVFNTFMSVDLSPFSCWPSCIFDISCFVHFSYFSISTFACRELVTLFWLSSILHVCLRYICVASVLAVSVSDAGLDLVCRALTGLAAGASDSFSCHCRRSLCLVFVQCHFRQVCFIATFLHCLSLLTVMTQLSYFLHLTYVPHVLCYFSWCSYSARKSFYWSADFLWVSLWIHARHSQGPP